MSVILRELPEMTSTAWDEELRSYRDATVFHSSAWHQALDESLPGKTVRFEVCSDDVVCGHWCGFLARKFGLKIFGAPLPGTGTDYMYPLFPQAPPVTAFLAAVRQWAQHRKIGMVDLGGEYYDDGSLGAEGFRLHPTRTYRVDLSGGEDAVWSRIKPAMRNKVRKAEKNAVIVSEDEDPGFPARFFDMLRAVFNRQGKAATYGPERVETIVRVLGGAGRLVGLTARRHGEPLAAAILLLDGTTAYYWAGASYESAYPFGANDLVQWRALQFAIGRGLVRYDGCGGGEYKEKLGGALVSLPAGHLTLNPMFGLVRASVARGVRMKQSLLGAVQRATRSL